MQAGIFEIFLLVLVPTILVLRQLPAFYAVSALVVATSAILLYAKYVVFAQLKRLNIPHDEPTLLLGDMMAIQKKGFGKFGADGVKKHGKIFGAYFGSAPCIFIADLDVLKDVLVKDFSNFTNHMGLSIFKESDVTQSSKTVLNATDDKWRNLRSTMTPAFTAGKMKLMIPLMDSCVENLVKSLDKERSKNKDSGVNIHTFVGGLTMDVVCTVALGTETNSSEDPNNPLIVNAKKIFEEFESMVGIMILVMFPYITTKVIPRLAKRLLEGPATDYLVSVAQQILEERKRNPQKRIDMVHLLLNAHQDNDMNEATAMPGDANSPDEAWNHKKHFMTDDEIAANLLLFLTAGYHTTAAALTFCLYALATNKEAQQKCVDELDGIDGPLSYDTLQNKLPYLESVITETLRMYPPVTVLTRETRNDYITSNGVQISAGTPIMVPIYAIHHMEEYYEDPETFNPARFSAEEKAKQNPLTFMPFGYGPRICLGMRLAHVELKLTLATLLKKFEFLPCPETEIPLGVNDRGGVLKPNKPLLLAVNARRND